jgi:predicted O-methyltransferase YrrM
MGHPVLTERFAQVCTEPSDINEHLPTFVRAVEALHATRVIELGVRYGVSTIAWLWALEHAGHLWSVDCSFPIAAPGSDVNLLDSQGPLGVIPWWTFILGYDEWPAVLDALPADGVDIVFIDTQHTYEQTTLELELYAPRVRSGGLIFLHDTALEVTGNAVTPQPPFPVRTAMTDYCKANGLAHSNVDYNSGLGTVIIP